MTKRQLPTTRHQIWLRDDLVNWVKQKQPYIKIGELINHLLEAYSRVHHDDENNYIKDAAEVAKEEIRMEIE